MCSSDKRAHGLILEMEMPRTIDMLERMRLRHPSWPPGMTAPPPIYYYWVTPSWLNESHLAAQS